jgi:hypothetical protein
MILLPEELDHPVRDLHAALALRYVHLLQCRQVREEPERQFYPTAYSGDRA